MEAFLILNGYKINASIDDQVKIILSVASGQIDQEELAIWVERHIQSRDL
jgi:prophage maintenance system killer protein